MSARAMIRKHKVSETNALMNKVDGSCQKEKKVIGKCKYIEVLMEELYNTGFKLPRQ
jgi:hypothetical protein